MSISRSTIFVSTSRSVNTPSRLSSVPITSTQPVRRSFMPAIACRTLVLGTTQMGGRRVDSFRMGRLLIAAPSRAAAIPKVPSSTEAGLPELQTTVWTALFLPKATPKPIVERVNTAMDKAMRDEAIARRLAELGADLPAPGERAPQALANLVRAEIDKWVPLIRSAGAVGE